MVRLIQTSVPEAKEHGGDRTEQGDDVTLKRGNSTAYLAARLKRDRPDLLQAVADGGMTVRAAAKVAH